MYSFVIRYPSCRLYVSPRLALTPAQKKQAPLQWLSEGHAQRLGDVDIPSLDEVRKTLVFNMEEAETISQTGSDECACVNTGHTQTMYSTVPRSCKPL